MRLSRYDKENFKKLPLKLLLLILITFAMIQFVSVSFINYNVLRKIGVDKNIIKLFLTKLIIINISMLIPFIIIVLI